MPFAPLEYNEWAFTWKKITGMNSASTLAFSHSTESIGKILPLFGSNLLEREAS